MADKKSKRTQEKEPASVVNLTNCEFKAVEWDGNAVEAVATIASALHQNAVAIAENATATAKLVEVFRSQNVSFEALLKLGGSVQSVKITPRGDA